MLNAGVETIENRRKLGLDVGERQILFVEQIRALFTVPLQAIELPGASPALNDQAHGVGRTLWRMRNARRQQQNFPGANWQLAYPAALGHSQHHVPFELMEEFFGRINVEIPTYVRATDGHHDKLAILIDEFIAHWWLEQCTVLIDPAVQIQRL